VSVWQEVGRDVFVRRYPFFDQNIGVVLGPDGVLVVDTRTTHAQARELHRELRELTPQPVRAVVNTHFHYDHTFGNRVFRPAPIWGHQLCAVRLVEVGEKMRAAASIEIPQLAQDLRDVVIDPPDVTFDERAVVDAVGRDVDLRYLGRGHTESDIVVVVPDADVLFAGDLLENGATPYFADAYPLDWPATCEAVVALVSGAVVPGHGDIADRDFAVEQTEQLRSLAYLARRVQLGEIGFDDALDASPFPRAASREPLERTLSQLRGELG
jgi:glyoxylase-like metal-dependent hydrolase (beta-lactamase superfamily II)